MFGFKSVACKIYTRNNIRWSDGVYINYASIVIVNFLNIQILYSNCLF